MDNWKKLMSQINRYLLSAGKEIKFIHVDGGNIVQRDKILAAVHKLRDMKDIEPIIIGVSMPDDDGELVTWPHYNVEFKVDNRVGGNVVPTGNQKNILKCLKLLSRK